MHQWGAPFTPQLDKILADFTARNPTVKAEAVRTSGEIHEALVKALAGGEPPDLTMMWRNNMPGFGAKNGLTVLDPYMARDKLDRGMYYENELKSSQFLGKTYALPAAAAGAWYLLFYNQAHFREAGLDASRPPQTWDEVTRYAAQLLKRGGDGRIERIGFDPGAYDAGTFNSFFTAWLMANGGKYSSDDGRKLLFDGPQATGALDWTLQVLRGNGGKDPVAEFFGRARKNTHQALISGERAMYVTNHSLPSNAVLVPELQYGIGLLPRGSQNGARGIVRGGWSNAIPRGVPAAHESWLLLQYLCASREGGGWFMEQQVRPSPIKAVERIAGAQGAAALGGDQAGPGHRHPGPDDAGGSGDRQADRQSHAGRVRRDGAQGGRLVRPARGAAPAGRVLGRRGGEVGAWITPGRCRSGTATTSSSAAAGRPGFRRRWRRAGPGCGCCWWRGRGSWAG